MNPFVGRFLKHTKKRAGQTLDSEETKKSKSVLIVEERNEIPLEFFQSLKDLLPLILSFLETSDLFTVARVSKV